MDDFIAFSSSFDDNGRHLLRSNTHSSSTSSSFSSQHDERIRISIHILRLLFRHLRNIIIDSVLVLIFIFYAFFFVVFFVITTSRGGRGQTNNTIDPTTWVVTLVYSEYTKLPNKRNCTLRIRLHTHIYNTTTCTNCMNASYYYSRTTLARLESTLK